MLARAPFVSPHIPEKSRTTTPGVRAWFVRRICIGTVLACGFEGSRPAGGIFGPGGCDLPSPSPLEERVRELERLVTELSGRLAAVESRATPVVEPTAAPPAIEAPAELTSAPSAAPAAPTIDAARLSGLPALVGRTCLVLGGAFLFRSLTESGTLSSAVGVALGLVYAIGWLFFADRAAAKGNHLSGAFHALASGLIAYPLAFEATTRFRLLSPGTAACVLAVTTFLGLVVAWRRVFPTVVWITVIAALLDGVGLLLVTQAASAFVPYLLGLAVGSLVLAYGHGWRGQRWVVAMVLDLVVLHLGGLRLIGKPAEWLHTTPLLAAQLGLVLVYLSAFVLRLLVQAHELTPFAIVQTGIVCLVGFEASLVVADGGVRTGIAIAALGAGLLLHAVLSRRSEARWGHRAASGYFSTLATFLAAEGTRVLLPAPFFPVVWASAAVAVAALALPRSRPVFQVHAALLSAAATVASGLFAASIASLALPASGPWPTLSGPVVAVLGLAIGTGFLTYRGAPLTGPDRLAKAARVAALAVALLGIGGAVARLLAAPIAGAPGAHADPGRLAVVRTGVLAAAALALAAWRALGGKRELGALAGAVLLLGGSKLVLEDLRIGSAAALVFSLALYGGALIVTPALLRRAPSPASDSEADR
ncbi:MAG: hypothetical protein U0610_16225 [bacterium]